MKKSDYLLDAMIIFCFFAIVLIFSPMITNNEPDIEPQVKAEYACVKAELSLNKLESHIVCGRVEKL